MCVVVGDEENTTTIGVSDREQPLTETNTETRTNSSMLKLNLCTYKEMRIRYSTSNGIYVTGLVCLRAEVKVIGVRGGNVSIW